MPCAWEVLGDSDALDNLADGTTVVLPLADVEKLVRDYADHLGPQLRNTKYVTPEVRAQQSHHLWTVQACLCLTTPYLMFDLRFVSQHDNLSAEGVCGIGGL